MKLSSSREKESKKRDFCSAVRDSRVHVYEMMYSVRNCKILAQSLERTSLFIFLGHLDINWLFLSKFGMGCLLWT